MANKTKKKRVNLDEVNPLELASVINPDLVFVVAQDYPQPQGEIYMPRNTQSIITDELDDSVTTLGGYVSRPTLVTGGRIAYKYGGIHINPANRGKLTETMHRTGKTKEELSHSKNPLTRKRAIFALNAEKWNHKH